MSTNFNSPSSVSPTASALKAASSGTAMAPSPASMGAIGFTGFGSVRSSAQSPSTSPGESTAYLSTRRRSRGTSGASRVVLAAPAWPLVTAHGMVLVVPSMECRVETTK